MSVNTGGFFFSNPTSTHLPPTAAAASTANGRDENDQENWSTRNNTSGTTPTMSSGYGINGSGQGVVNGYNAGNMQHQQQQQPTKIIPAGKNDN
mmetsp:Transcript_39995/g.83660  ORF Transcript_39995/g.83660 Transcript_39995/m.83660 type:complete len:94 (-) Transcript_39995:44-325(-)